MKNCQEFMKELKALGCPADAEGMKWYHKVDHLYLGVRAPETARLSKEFAAAHDEQEILDLSDALWALRCHEAYQVAGGLLDHPKVTDLDAIWVRLSRYKEDLEAWAMADGLCHAAFRVLKAKPEYLDEMEKEWLGHRSFWVRRACLTFTLYSTKKDGDPRRSLKWAATMVDDREWFIQKAIGWYLRELSKVKPEPVKAFLAEYGARMKPFAVREGSKYLPV